MISPAIGRKVWFFPIDESGMVQFQPDVPLDATVIYPWGDRSANLRITDHAGVTHIRTWVCLVQDDEPAPASSHAVWMPYQRGQAAKAAA
jgi:hypothetical protein